MTRKIMFAAVVALTVLAAGIAFAGTYKNKTTGEVIVGELTSGKINNKSIFKLEGGGNRFIKSDEWEVIEAGKTDETAKADDSTKTDESSPEKTTTPRKAKARVFIIPIRGAIMSKAMCRATERALVEAKKKRCNLILFHIDTPGGRVDVASRMVEIIKAVDWAPVVSWVEGTEQAGAISAGAYICMATEKIFMAPAMSLGGAVPYRTSGSGSAEVDAKFQSIFRARFRALAQKRGHPHALVEAMVDSSTSVIQVFVNNEQRFVSSEVAKQLEKDHKKDGKFRRGKTVCAVGKVLTVTTDEAIEYGLASAVTKDVGEIAVQMGFEGFKAFEAKWFTKWVKDTANREKQRFAKARNVFRSNYQQAFNSDPTRFLYPEQRGTKAWKDMTKRAMGYLKNCAAALKEIDKIANDPNADLHLSKDELSGLKSELSAMYQRLGADK